MSKRFHLAQINIARMRAPLDDPAMAGFVAQLDPVNALAEASPGFVWRLQTDDGDATSLRVFEDPLILVNMSVWESVGDLQAFAYRSHHVTVFRDRGKWFEPFGGVSKALWWIPAGEVPTVEDARKRLAFLSDYGESPIAFSFARQFPAPPVQAIDYDKRTFVSRVNSANGDADERTVFHYRHRNDTVWATYEGGNVRLGSLIAVPDTAGLLDMRYQHVNAERTLRTGACWSAPELLPDGRVRLHEYWQWTSGDLTRGVSLVEEVA